MEPDDAQDDAPYSPPTAAERVTFNALVAASIQAREAVDTSKEQPNQVVVWESAISAANVPETEALGQDHTTTQDEATPEITQVVGELGGAAASAAGVDSSTSLVAPEGVPVEPPLPSQPAAVLAVEGQHPATVVAPTAILHQVEGNLVVDNNFKPTTLRRSERSKSTADVHILQKTEKVAAKKNLGSIGMSFTSFSDSKIAENLSKIGINLGSSEDLVRSSTIAIKNLEVDRMVLHANRKKNKNKENSKPLLPESDDEKDARLDAILGHICGKSNENVRVLENDLILDLSPVDRKKRSSFAKNLKKGKSSKSSKKPRTPSKIVIQ
jgi:hypothetical protein